MKTISLILLISLGVISAMPIQENPYELGISIIANQEGWNQSQISMQKGSYSRFLLFDTIQLTLKVETSSSTETVFARLHKGPLMEPSIKCLSFGVPEGCSTYQKA